MKFLILVNLCLLSISTIHIEASTYRYSKDISFFEAFFMSNSLPIVDYPTVKKVCTGCHWTMLPGLLPVRSWEKIMNEMEDHFGQKIEMTSDLQSAILYYLKVNAAELTESSVSVDILDSIGNRVPIRLSESKFFEKTHSDIGNNIWKDKKVVFKGNCIACHKDLAKTGSFSGVVLP